MKVGEDRLTAADQGPLLGLRFFDFDDQVGLAEHVGGAIDQLRAHRGVGLVGQAGALTSGTLDDHLVAPANELFRSHWQQSYSVLV